MGQAGFRPKYFTIDHYITLRFFIEKTWDKQGDKAFCFFVDFKKAFDIDPRDKLWNKMEELEVPTEYRVVAYKLYEQIKMKIRTKVGMSKCFGSNIGVK